MAQIEFPTKLLKPQAGTAEWTEFGLAIEVPLARFALPNWKPIETTVSLTCISLPLIELNQFAGRQFTFPQNPQLGYVDGSIYIGERHHPVDVSLICFGEVENNASMMTFTTTIAFTFEGLAVDSNAQESADQYDDTDWQFSALIDFKI
jgi:hypothetical protein